MCMMCRSPAKARITGLGERRHRARMTSLLDHSVNYVAGSHFGRSYAAQREHGDCTRMLHERLAVRVVVTTAQLVSTDVDQILGWLTSNGVSQ